MKWLFSLGCHVGRHSQQPSGGEIMDRDILEYNIASIRRNINKPFRYNNMELVTEEFPYIKEEFPNSMLICTEDSQYVIVNERARKALLKQLTAVRNERAAALKKVENTLFVLNNARCAGEV